MLILAFFFSSGHARAERTSRNDSTQEAQLPSECSLVCIMASSSSRSVDYLEGLPGTVFMKLYQQPSTALAVFRRMLPHLGEQCR